MKSDAMFKDIKTAHAILTVFMVGQLRVPDKVFFVGVNAQETSLH